MTDDSSAPRPPAPQGPEPRVHLVSDTKTLAEWCERLEDAELLALDVESNGLHAYAAELCIVQLATETDVLVIDPFATSVLPLARLFEEGPPTVVHDLGFDARMLARAGAPLVRVRDTALAAGLLGRTATGLASVLAQDLGVTVDKSLQHADWKKRPLDARAVAYLAGDVRYLAALWERLSRAVDEAGIGAELEEETRHRLREASAPEDEPAPLVARLKGVDALRPEDLPLVRALAEARESLARELDVPVYKIVGNDVLFEIARARPTSLGALERIPGAHRGRARALSRVFLDLVRAPQRPLSPEELFALKKERLPDDERKLRKKREERLLGWRKTEAERRNVNAQVVLPGHVLRRLAARGASSAEDLGNIAGMGGFRVERYGERLLALVAGAEGAEGRP